MIKPFILELLKNLSPIIIIKVFAQTICDIWGLLCGDKIHAKRLKAQRKYKESFNYDKNTTIDSPFLLVKVTFSKGKNTYLLISNFKLYSN